MRTKETVSLKKERIMRFNEGMPGYNPLFVDQGDSKIEQAYGQFLKVRVTLDSEALCNVDARREAMSRIRKNGSMKNPELESIPEVSPLSGQSEAIVSRVHKTLTHAPTAYKDQVNSGVENIKNSKSTAERVFRALGKKGVSTTVSRETIKMIERGVPIDRIKKEVSDLFAESSKIPSNPRKSYRSNIVLPRDVVPQIVMKQRDSIPSVTIDELHEVSVDIKSDPVLRKIAEFSRKPVEVIASSSARNQVDEVLKTVAASSILDGTSKEPTDNQVKLASLVEAPRQNDVTASTMSKIARDLGVPGPDPRMSPRGLFKPSNPPMPMVNGNLSFMMPTQKRSGPVTVPSSFPVPGRSKPAQKVVESPFLKAGERVTELIGKNGIRLAEGNMVSKPTALRPQDSVKNMVEKKENSGTGISKFVWVGLGAGVIWLISRKG